MKNKNTNILGQTVLILGHSGTGKTSSIKNLEPKETLILMAQFKPLPFKGWANNYSINKIEEGKGCILINDDFPSLIKKIETINEKNLSFKNIIIDDFQFYAQRDVFSNADEKGFNKWIDLAKTISEVLMKVILLSLSKNLNIAIFWHCNTDTVAEEKGTLVKTSSKFIDEKLTVESLFTTVLKTEVQDGKYMFRTNSSGDTIGIKSPAGVFEGLIPNDLNYVFSSLTEYSQ